MYRISIPYGVCRINRTVFIVSVVNPTNGSFYFIKKRIKPHLNSSIKKMYAVGN